MPWGFPGGSDSKASACIAQDLGPILGSGRSPGEGNVNPLQYFCLDYPMDGGVGKATVHGFCKETRLSNFTSSNNTGSKTALRVSPYPNCSQEKKVTLYTGFKRTAFFAVEATDVRKSPEE